MPGMPLELLHIEIPESPSVIQSNALSAQKRFLNECDMSHSARVGSCLSQSAVRAVGLANGLQPASPCVSAGFEQTADRQRRKFMSAVVSIKKLAEPKIRDAIRAGLVR